MGYIWEEIFGNLLAIILFIVGVALFIGLAFLLVWGVTPVIDWIVGLHWIWKALIALAPFICFVIYLRLEPIIKDWRAKKKK